MSDIARHDFLLEIGTEEVPARMAKRAADDLKRLLLKGLEDARIELHDAIAQVTPRRIVLEIPGLPEKQSDMVEEKRGPAAKIAFDDSGAPTKAAIGFAKSVGLEVDQLQRVEMKGAEYLFARVEHKGEATTKLLQEMLPSILKSMRFPKSMRWGSVKQPFIRPVHWIVALLGAEVVPFEFAGIASGNQTRGHRFMGNQDWMELSNPGEYARAMRDNFVITDVDERRQIIQEGLEKRSKDMKLDVIEDPGLLDTVTHLVEYPVVMLGTFDEKYLRMPDEVLITSMRTHQKYFACEKDGKLANTFFFVSNTKPRNEKVVCHGNERVLEARLADAYFFYSEDRKKQLEDFVDGLSGQTFLRGMGTMLEKTQRLETLAASLARTLVSEHEESARRAAHLCKADLSTLMVSEFPDLQGRMGQDYAELYGEPEGVSRGIVEHYLPRFAGDVLPETSEGMVLSLADKIDIIAACYHLNLIPTATKDPYALRRSALGIARILAEKALPLGLTDLVARGVDNLGVSLKDRDELVATIVTFIAGRLRNWLTGDYATEVVDACMAAGADYPYDVYEKVKAVVTLRDRPDYEDLVHPFKRVMNITRGENV